MSHCSSAADPSGVHERGDRPSVWRIVRDVPVVDGASAFNAYAGCHNAVWNMAADEALLDSVSANQSPPTLRLYQWDRPAITVGRFQNVGRTVLLERCRAMQIPIVRRITGGRGILHGQDLTVSLAASLRDLGFEGKPPSTIEIYLRLAGIFIEALKRLNIDAMSGDCVRLRTQDRVGNCFNIVSRADIVATQTGCKLIGAALHRRGDFVLQQASIPLRQMNSCPGNELSSAGVSESVFVGDVDYRKTADPAFKAGAPSDVSTGVSEVDFELDADALADALTNSLQEMIHRIYFGDYVGRVMTAAWGAEEQREITRLAEQRYLTDAWNLEGIDTSVHRKLLGGTKCRCASPEA